MADCRKELFDLMSQEHDVQPLETELFDIITLVEGGMKADLRKIVEDMKNDCAEGQIRIATTHWRRRIEKLLGVEK